MLEHARRDAKALATGGVNGIIVENYGDAPLHRGRVGPHTVSAMTLAVREVQDVTDAPLGINVLRNDARSALGIAAITGASFIRVNVHVGVMLADEGIIQGRASETLRYRRNLDTDVKIFADVLVKHAAPVGDQDLRRAARVAYERGLADALIVSGPATGEPTPLDEVVTVKEALADVPVLVGSGANEGNLAELLSAADGAIVGTSLKIDGDVGNPVDRARVARMVELAEGVRGRHS